MKIAHLCEAAAVKLVPHNPLGPVSSAAAAHLAAAVENFAVLEMCFVPGTYLQDVFPRQLEMAGGDAVLGDAPGLGVELDEAALAGNPWEPGGWYPELRRPDGAFTNW